MIKPSVGGTLATYAINLFVALTEQKLESQQAEKSMAHSIHCPECTTAKDRFDSESACYFRAVRNPDH